MIVHPPIAVVYIDSNYFMNMIHAIDNLDAPCCSFWVYL
jgi:hypothetical protein